MGGAPIVRGRTGPHRAAGMPGPARALGRRRRVVARGALVLVAAALAFGPVATGGVLAAGAATPTSVATTKARITANWKAFFAGSTPAARKITLLQDGSRFAAIIRGQATSPMAKSVAAKVAKVTITSSTNAKVRYSLTVGGKTALANQTGTAVLQRGTWKVGVASFCALLALEQVTTPACPKKK